MFSFSKPVSVSEFPKYVAYMSKDSGVQFKDEYEVSFVYFIDIDIVSWSCILLKKENFVDVGKYCS